MDKFAYMKELRRRPDLSPAEYQLLVTVWTYTDERCKNARPGAQRLAVDLCKTERVVRSQLSDLEKKGYLAVQSTGGSPRGGKKTATVYALALPARADDDPWTSDAEQHWTSDAEQPERPVLLNSTGANEQHGTSDAEQHGTSDAEQHPIRSFIKSNQSAVGPGRAEARPPAHPTTSRHRTKATKQELEHQQRMTQQDLAAEQQRQQHLLQQAIARTTSGQRIDEDWSA